MSNPKDPLDQTGMIGKKNIEKPETEQIIDE